MSFDLERLNKSACKITNFLRRNPKRPGLESIHKLRTDTRSLETTFTTLGLTSKKKVKHLLRDLASVRKRAGKVRDMDVLTADALTVEHHGEQDCLVQLLEHLGATRSKGADKLRRTIETFKPKLGRDLKRNFRRVESLLEKSARLPANSNGVTAPMARALELSSELNRPARLNRNNLHPYRLKIKELHNVLRLSDQPADSEFLKELGEVKDALGEWHDWEELLAISRGVLNHGSSCGLIKHLKQASDSKYENALASASRLRRKYLNNGSSTRSIQT